MTGPMGRLLTSVLTAVAEFERDQIRPRLAQEGAGAAATVGRSEPAGSRRELVPGSPLCCGCSGLIRNPSCRRKFAGPRPGRRSATISFVGRYWQCHMLRLRPGRQAGMERGPC